MKVIESVVLRHAIQDCLQAHSINNPALECDLTGVIERLLQDPNEMQKRIGTERAMLDGMTAGQAAKSEWSRLFHTNPNWDTKTAREFLEWLTSRPASQQLSTFADWWYKHDHRGKLNIPPTFASVREYWQLAFTEGAGERQRAFPLPEGV